jgi:flagellar assembly protein FliH
MATIIRKDSPREAPSGMTVQPVAFSFADMRGQANDYLGSVRAEAAKIVQQAHQQAEQIRRQAEAAGRKAAEAAIERVLDERVGTRMQTLLPALESLLSEINSTKAELLNHWEKSSLRVASAIAARIVRRELAQNPQITVELIAESLRLASGMEEVSVHISPQDYDNLGSQVGRLVKTVGRLGPSSVVADPNVSAGGCIVKTKFGEIDQQIESQLKRIEQELG